jgi:CRISPR type IV-associated protein Csf3
MRPLRITVKLQTGQVCIFDGRLSLDGLLSSVWFQEHHPELLAYGAPENEWPNAELPLERRVPAHDSGAWYWAVSLGQYEASKEYIYYWHRRFAADRERYLDLSGKKSGRINTAAGYMKAYRHPAPVIVTPEITWYAVGDADELMRMLRKISWMGKNRSQGFGWVADWLVEPCEADYSEYWRDGRRMRDLPTTKEKAEGFEGIRPPYWVRRNRYPVVVWDGPGTAANIRAV